MATVSAILKRQDGVGQVTPFGSVLHVTGNNDDLLRAALAPYRADSKYRVERIESTLEDVFISLMSGASDNFSRN